MVKKEIHKKEKLSKKELSNVVGGVSGTAPSGAKFYTALSSSLKVVGSTSYNFNWVVGTLTKSFPCSIKTMTKVSGTSILMYDQITISKTALGTNIGSSDLTWLGDLSKHKNFVVKLTT